MKSFLYNHNFNRLIIMFMAIQLLSLAVIFYSQEEQEVIDAEDNVDVDLAELEIFAIPNNSIHFITGASKSLTPNARDLCAVESAALHNPYTPVLLSMMGSNKMYPSRIVKHLVANYDNIRFRKFDVLETIEGTMLDGWYQRSGIPSSKFKFSYLSSIAKVALLYKHGGWYINGDVIVLKSLENIGYDNVISLQYEDHEPNSVTDAFMKFEPKHPFLDDYLREIMNR